MVFVLGLNDGGHMEPPDLDPDFWERPEIIEAAATGQLGQFLLAYRGARRARYSQDQLARWLGCGQATVSEIENGRTVPTVARTYDVLRALHVPASVVTRWGGV